MTPLLRLDGVACRRGGRLLFRGVTLTLGPGEAVLLQGPNGIGKSSLLRVAAGLLPAMAGTVARNAAVALSDEALALDAEWPLARALGFWVRLDGGDGAAVNRALGALALDTLADVPVRMLSTGQRRRAGLARVVASGAPLWLLDEPGNGLDTASLDGLAALMAAHRAAGGAILAASHQALALPGAKAIDLGAFRPAPDALAEEAWEA